MRLRFFGGFFFHSLPPSVFARRARRIQIWEFSLPLLLLHLLIPLGVWRGGQCKLEPLPPAESSAPLPTSHQSFSRRIRGAASPQRGFFFIFFLSSCSRVRMNNNPWGIDTRRFFFWVTMLFQPFQELCKSLDLSALQTWCLFCQDFWEGLEHWEILWRSPAPLFCLPHGAD